MEDEQDEQQPKRFSIITKTGDKGTTSSLRGGRVKKSDESLDILGEWDELNVVIGKLLVEREDKMNQTWNKSKYLDNNIGEGDDTIKKKLILDIQCVKFLNAFQSHIMQIGSFISSKGESKYFLEENFQKLIDEMEALVYDIENSLPPLTQFILPGGSLPGVSSHQCRVTARKVERIMYQSQFFYTTQNSNHQEPIDSTPKIQECFLPLMKVINRLSDFFFAYARLLNHLLGKNDVIYSKTF
jgi:cob(I)alamin adenosyltransferase